MKKPSEPATKNSFHIILNYLGPLLYLHYSNKLGERSALLQKLKLSKQKFTDEFRQLCEDPTHKLHQESIAKSHDLFRVDARPTKTDSQAITAVEFMQKLLFIANLYSGFKLITKSELKTYYCTKRQQNVVYSVTYPVLQSITIDPEEFATRQLVLSCLKLDLTFSLFIAKNASAIIRLHSLICGSSASAEQQPPTPQPIIAAHQKQTNTGSALTSDDADPSAQPCAVRQPASRVSDLFNPTHKPAHDKKTHVPAFSCV